MRIHLPSGAEVDLRIPADKAYTVRVTTSNIDVDTARRVLERHPEIRLRYDPDYDRAVHESLVIEHGMVREDGTPIPYIDCFHLLGPSHQALLDVVLEMAREQPA